MSALTQMPESFAAGTTLELSRTHTSYLGSDGWTMNLHLAGPSAAISATGAFASGAWAFTLSAITTQGLLPGYYRWVERATKAGVVVDVASGLVTLTPDLTTAIAGAAQSWEERTLVLVEAAITDIISGKIQSYQIAGRGAEKLGLEDLKKVRGELVAAVRQQRSGRAGRQHLVNFLRPS